MTIEFFDRQQVSSSVNGIRIEKQGDLLRLFESLVNREPFFCELVGDNGYKQLVGVGGRIGCVQYSANNGAPPYLMAVAEDGVNGQPYVEFLIGNTPTPVSTRYCIPFEKIRQITVYFLQTGERDPSVSWEEI